MTDDRHASPTEAELSKTDQTEPPLPDPDPVSGLIESDDLPLTPPPLSYDMPPTDIEPDPISPELVPLPPDLPATLPAGDLPDNLAHNLPLFLLHQHPIYLGVDNVLVVKGRTSYAGSTITRWWLAHLCTDPPVVGNSLPTEGPDSAAWEVHPLDQSRLWHTDPISVVGILRCERPDCTLSGTITDGKWDDIDPAAPDDLEPMPDYDDQPDSQPATPTEEN